MAYLQVGDIRTFVVKQDEFVGAVYYSHKIYSQDTPVHAYLIVTLDGLLRRVIVGRVKFKPAIVSKEQEKLLRSMASKRNQITEMERQINALKEKCDSLYRDCDVLSDNLAELYYTSKKGEV